VGDSFCIEPWSHSYATLLRAELAQESVALLNLSKAGTGPLVYVTELETVGRAFGPDLVLFNYYAGNDLTDVRYKRGKTWDARGPGVTLRSALRPLFRRCFLYHYYAQRRRTRAAPQAELDADVKRWEKQGQSAEVIGMAKERKINYHLMDLAAKNPRHFRDNLLVEGEDDKYAWRKIREVLVTAERECREMGATLVVVVHPAAVQVNKSHYGFYGQLGFELTDEFLTTDVSQRLMRDLCGELRVKFLDLLPAFRSCKDQNLYLHLDCHYNESGNRLAAKQVLTWLRRQNLLRSE